ncbi:uncharacterized protein LOC112177459 [Rosa chinensis]|uniref:uncharacterized protein LOC112177459 n=1 Tax=Rosa chinensis TaxID=74649 RepID=UPI000D08921F|nr:uncharacterized protein LOC112177459 [Rosa chinensis]
MDVKLMFRCMFDFKLNSVDILVRDSNGSTILVPYCRGSSSSTSATTSLDDVSCVSSCLSMSSSNIIDASEYLGVIGQRLQRVISLMSGKALYGMRIKKCAKRYSDGYQWSIGDLKNKVNDFFYIKKLNNVHTCKGVLRQQKSKLLGSHVVKSEIANELKSNPQLKPKGIVSRLKHSFGLDVSYKTAWYGKELARKAVHGHDGDSYYQLHWLFKSCIPLLFVDAAHLKSKYKRYMLCATRKNGNQELFPFAFAIVDSENHANHGIDSPHSYCYYHLKENVRGVNRKQSENYFVDKIVEEFMKVAYSPTLGSYNFNLHNLKKEGGPPIEEFLQSLPLEKWCNAFFKGNKYGKMANSVAVGS